MADQLKAARSIKIQGKPVRGGGETHYAQVNMFSLVVAAAIVAAAVAVSPPGWAACGGLPNTYNRTACPGNMTCCKQLWMPSDGNWGCCPYGVGAVCCSNGYTCCPSGTVCKANCTDWNCPTTCEPADRQASFQHEDSPFHVVGTRRRVHGGNVYGDMVCKTGPPLPFDTVRKNVLIIGDSVSIGYTPFVATALASEALVQHSPWGGDGGAEETKYGAMCFDNLVRAPDGTVLEPDVLMFNWGLHNSLSGNCTPPCVPGAYGPPDEYLPFLKQIVARIKLVGRGKTKLLFAITSPDLCNKPIDDIQRQLNAQAVALMAAEGIPTVDLYAAIINKCGPVPTVECFGEKGCFCPHCPPGYEWLATSTIAPAIKTLL